MKKLVFETTEEFEKVFKTSSLEVTNAIAAAIEDAVIHRKSSAKCFDITFQNHDERFEISLPKSEWVGALNSCLDFYHKNECFDKAIDTWKLVEAVKII